MPAAALAVQRHERERVEASINGQMFGPFLTILGALLIVGIAIAYLILRQLPQREALVASAAPTNPASVNASNGADRQFPPGHPVVQLPKEARDFISNLEKKALANPKNVTLLNRLGDVSLRAAQFDPSYYGKAADAYGRVLKIDPDNLDALRGVGNIDFDQHKADQAIAAYEHYLGKKPDDPDVRTDLATMLLTSGAADQAVFQYKKVIEAHPTFFEANFNLGVAYGEMNDMTSARAQFEKALKLAPDAAARDRVNQMIASLNSETAPAASSNLSSASAPQAATNAPSAAPATFHGAIETMLHDIPFAGPKVQAVQWSSQNKARVLMNNFPMDQMPEFAAAKFVSDLKQGIDQAKSAHQVSGQVELDICDASSGRVMKSITE